MLYPSRINILSLEIPEYLITMNVTATCYYPTVAQCDSDPYTTASGAKINRHSPEKHRWIAVSRDLKKHLEFGDRVFVSGTGVYDGYWTVHDVTNKRFSGRIDFLVNSKSYISKWEDVKIIF